MSPVDRQGWLFPERSGSFDGIDLEHLNPADEDDRTILIAAEHSDWVPTLEASAPQIQVNGRTASPALHLSMHEMVANQIWNDDPPGVWEAARRLTAIGFDRHEVLHMLMSAAAGQLWSVLHDHLPFDHSAYQRALDSLPESWLDLDDDLDDDLADLHGDLDDDLDDDLADLHGDLDLDEEEAQLRLALDVLAEHGPLAAEDLAGLAGIDEDVLDIVCELPQVAHLANDHLAFAPCLLSSVVLTHRLSTDEAGADQLALTVDLAPLVALVCDDDHIHLPGGKLATLDGWLEEDPDKPALSGNTVLRGPPGWLGGAEPGALVGLRLVATDPDRRDELGYLSHLEVVAVAAHDPIPDTFGAQLRVSFDRFGDGDGMPVPLTNLVYQLAVDAPALTSGTLAPLNELLAIAGFEVVEGYAGPVGTDWRTFSRLSKVVHTGLLHGLDQDDIMGMTLICKLYLVFEMQGSREISRDVARAVGNALSDPEMAETFAHAFCDAQVMSMDFLAALRVAAGNRHAADLAWVESLIASRCAALERAEACLRIGLGADPRHAGLLGDAAWYASDRGDARRALRHLERIEDGGDYGGRIPLLRSYVTVPTNGSPTGRNEPCGCGSGKKFKHCCLNAAPENPVPPLPERAPWLWDKLRWWLQRVGPMEDFVFTTLALQGVTTEDEFEPGDFGLLTAMDLAASLLLFDDGAIGEFISQRADLLPDDEAALVRQWASTKGALYEVLGVRPGEGISLRHLGADDTFEVRERKGSGALEVGQVIFAHPLPDGVSTQLVGGVVPIPPSRVPELEGRLVEGASSSTLAMILGDIRYRLTATSPS